MKYNCCQQAGVCPKNGICKPFHSPTKPWKRFICECRDGYHGDNCEKPKITSCHGYANGSQKSGEYELVGSDNTAYNAYCHFSRESVWTLVQSYSFANRSLEQFKEPLFIDLPLSENYPTWTGYRLSKSRMRSIEDNSTALLFTCDYEKISHESTRTDYVQIMLDAISNETKKVDVLELRGRSSSISVGEGRAVMGEHNLSHCQMQFRQDTNLTLHVVFEKAKTDPSPTCPCQQDERGRFFGSYHDSLSNCVKEFHRCVQNENSTTQLWVGTLWTATLIDGTHIPSHSASVSAHPKPKPSRCCWWCWWC